MKKYSSKSILFLLAILTVSTIIVPMFSTSNLAYASPGWLNGWNYRRQLTINGGLVDELLTDFPVLVKLDSSFFDFSKVKTNGEDIRFTNSDETTLLKYEIEKWNSASGQAQIWVKIPSLATGSNTIF